jgi:hypothetical protein
MVWGDDEECGSVSYITFHFIMSTIERKRAEFTQACEARTIQWRAEPPFQFELYVDPKDDSWNTIERVMCVFKPTPGVVYMYTDMMFGGENQDILLHSTFRFDSNVDRHEIVLLTVPGAYPSIVDRHKEYAGYKAKGGFIWP